MISRGPLYTLTPPQPSYDYNSQLYQTEKTVIVYFGSGLRGESKCIFIEPPASEFNIVTGLNVPRDPLQTWLLLVSFQVDGAKTIIAPSIDLSKVHHAFVCCCDRLAIAPYIKSGGEGNNGALKVAFSAHSLAHLFAVDRSATKGDTSLWFIAKEISWNTRLPSLWNKQHTGREMEDDKALSTVWNNLHRTA